MDNNDKQTKITQKELKRIEVQKRKFQLEQERVLKPGECNKFVTAIINKEIITEAYGSKIEETLKSININVEKSSLSTPGTITWKRRFNQKIITEKGDVIEFDDVEKEEPYLVIIFGIKQFLEAMKEKRLVEKVMAAEEMCSHNPASTLLIVYGLKAYCRKNPKATNAQEIEMHLTQLQLLANCSHRLFETPDEVALTILQISRSIAEEPHKAKQNEKLDREQLYLVNDIKVSANENDSASLARLWHTQLICLPKVTFDVAQSITKDYAMPRDLIAAYKKFTGNKEQMLADIKIIKTGPLAKNRRIGPELSRKIYTLMTSKNPNELL
jgi:ERCC4 domain